MKDVVGQKPAPGTGKALRDDGLQANERNLTTELADEKARKDAKDILLDEAAHILSDQADLMKPTPRFATDAKPG